MLERATIHREAVRRTWARVQAPLRTWIARGTDLIYPRACALCQENLDSSTAGALCQACCDAVVDRGPACVRCGVGVLADHAAVGCRACRTERFHFESVVRLGPYAGELRQAVLQIKSDRRRALALALGHLLAEARGEPLRALAADGVVPVPMHWSRQLSRGTNSAQTLADRVARRLGLPLAADLLVRRRRTAPQARLSPRRRALNVSGAFRIRPHADLPGARLLIVDDIMTTGATANEAAKILTQAGATVVGVVVLARAEGLA